MPPASRRSSLAPRRLLLLLYVLYWQSSMRQLTLYLAVAVVNNLDAIVSWNFRHMVNVKTRVAVDGINRLEGYREIEIVTPEEVIERG